MHLRWKIAQKLEIRWWRNYLKGKSWEDYLAWKQRYWQKFLQTNNVIVNPNDKILEVGCGPAGIFCLFPNHEVTAVEPLLGYYQRQLPGFKKENYTNVAFHPLPFESFNFEQDFDKVFCLNVINHVSAIDVCFKKLQKAVGKSGKLFLTVDAHNFLIPKFLFRLAPLDILHPHQLDLKGYQWKMRKAGFVIEQVIILKKGFLFNYYLIVANADLNSKR
jgi:2-polyprenyl-6-hydroxyphenyl methylase/3-demethylubiquinone-9 3-methyltransferase